MSAGSVSFRPTEGVISTNGGCRFDQQGLSFRPTGGVISTNGRNLITARNDQKKRIIVFFIKSHNVSPNTVSGFLERDGIKSPAYGLEQTKQWHERDTFNPLLDRLRFGRNSREYNSPLLFILYWIKFFPAPSQP